jgi:hypothetical protein
MTLIWYGRACREKFSWRNGMIYVRFGLQVQRPTLRRVVLRTCCGEKVEATSSAKLSTAGLLRRCRLGRGKRFKLPMSTSTLHHNIAKSPQHDCALKIAFEHRTVTCLLGTNRPEDFSADCIGPSVASLRQDAHPTRLAALTRSPIPTCPAHIHIRIR